MDDDQLHGWFVTIVLPLEARLLTYIRYHWKLHDEARDILHDVYEKALIGAAQGIPQQGSAYVFAIARNLLVNRIKRARIVSFNHVSDFDDIPHENDLLTPECHASARQELQRMLDGMKRLPPRCREVVRLRKMEGLSTQEVAERLNVGIAAIERQMALGMRALTDFMRGGSGRVERKRYGASIRLRKETDRA